mmetsp:Transcript_27965/g.63259  ORF Transcript_27965/g.63259 Transcript_27965/m.63259 type:complete len:264 (-) Transcript_27965:94-885(-)
MPGAAAATAWLFIWAPTPRPALQLRATRPGSPSEAMEVVGRRCLRGHMPRAAGVLRSPALRGILAGTLAGAVLGSFPRPAEGAHVMARGEGASCEGYWPPASVCTPLGEGRPAGEPTEENAGCPQWRIDKSWAMKNWFFMARLGLIEVVAGQAAEKMGGSVTEEDLAQRGIVNTSWVNVYKYKGLSPSRIQASKMVGSKEFVDIRGRSAGCWPDGYSRYYIKEYGVVPSKEFQDYVRKFSILGFTANLLKAKLDAGVHEASKR